jgi:hypothetical protein
MSDEANLTAYSELSGFVFPRSPDPTHGALKSSTYDYAKVESSPDW